jgi:hypothetical protein
MQGSWPTAGEDRANVVVEAWAQALRKDSRPQSLGCLSSTCLDQLIKGSLGQEKARRALVHIAFCESCRSRESQLRAQLRLPPLRDWNLADLRQAAALDPARVASVLDDVRNWFSGILMETDIDSGLQDGTPIFASVYDRTDTQVEQTGCLLLRPMAIDRRGRVFVEMAFPDGSTDAYVDVVIGDETCHIRLCTVPIRDSLAKAIVDCGFLGVFRGTIATGVIRASVVPAERIQHWIRPRVLPTFEALAQRKEDATECVDCLCDIVSVFGDSWADFLRSDLSQRGANASSIATIGYVLELVYSFTSIWKHSNGVDPTWANDLVDGLTSCINLSHPRRRRNVDPDTEAVRYRNSDQRE